MSKMFYISWPESGSVSEETILSWAKDAIANGEIEGPINLDSEALARQLDHAGKITWLGAISNNRGISWGE